MEPRNGASQPPPVYVETSNVSFSQQTSILSTEDLVRFRFGPASGSAQGMSYATKDGWVDLKKDVHAEAMPTDQNAGGTTGEGNPSTSPTSVGTGTGRLGTPPTHPRSKPAGARTSRWTRFTAGRALYQKQAGTIALWGPIEVTQENCRLESEHGQLSLDALNRITGILLEGGVRASESLESDVAHGSAHRNSSTTPQRTLLTATARRANGQLDPESGELRRLLVEGEVHAEMQRGSRGRDGSAGASTALGRLDSRRLEIDFSGVPAEPQKGIASGDVELSLESFPARVSNNEKPAAKANPALPDSRPAPEIKTLKASELLFSFLPGGRSLKDAETPGPGEFVLRAADPKVGKRVITAGRFLMAFDSRNRLERVLGLNGTRIVSQPSKLSPPGTHPQESSADNLRAAFDSATGALSALDQAGHFQFTDGARRASAEKAEYASTPQRVRLTGDPKIWDALTEIRANRILLNPDSDTAEGVGNVRSTHLGKSVKDQSAVPNIALGSSPPRAPSDPGREDSNALQSTNVVADRVITRRRDQFVHYEGQVRAWRGADVIESSSLNYYGNEHRLSSGEQVVTSHLAPAPTGPVDTAAAVRHPAGGPFTLRARRLDFFEEARKASYQGNVELKTENATLRADRVDVYFSRGAAPGESQVDYAVADGHVVVTEPGRRATGDHGEYFAGPGKIVLRGGSPTLYDEKQGYTTGRSLTFFFRDDRLLVDGGDRSPAFSKRRMTQ